MYLNFLNVHAFHAPESPDCAAESPEQVFHAPGQSPYSVLVEQRGVEELLLLESQVYWTLPCWTLDTVLCWSHRYTGHCTVLDTGHCNVLGVPGILDTVYYVGIDTGL